LSKTGVKIYYFCQHSEKAKKTWPNDQIIFFLANSFKKGQMATLVLRSTHPGTPPFSKKVTQEVTGRSGEGCVPGGRGIFIFSSFSFSSLSSPLKYWPEMGRAVGVQVRAEVK